MGSSSSDGGDVGEAKVKLFRSDRAVFGLACPSRQTIWVFREGSMEVVGGLLLK